MAENEKKIKAVGNNEMRELANSVLSAMNSILNKKAETIVSVNPDKEGWRIVVEVVERVAVPSSMDLMGRYEIKTDHNGKIRSYNQVLLRHRNDAIVSETGGTYGS